MYVIKQFTNTRLIKKLPWVVITRECENWPSKSFQHWRHVYKIFIRIDYQSDQKCITRLHKRYRKIAMDFTLGILK